MASTNENVGINRTYKDRLFRLRFCSVKCIIKIYEAELRQEAREEGCILERIQIYKEDNYSDMDIMKKLILRFDIILQEAQEYLDKYYEETDKSNS